MSITRRFAALGATALVAGAGFAAAPTSSASAGPAAAPAAAAATCTKTWGSLPKTNSTMVVGPLTNVRAGRHACYDRLVFDVRGKAPGYRVEYVDKLIQDGSGTVYPLRGGAKIKITLHAPSYDQNGDIVYLPPNRAEAVNVTGFTTFRQVRWLGSWEGYSEMGVGVRARLPFTVHTLYDGTNSKVVVDVAHSWR
jgi:hypothetical protein